MNGQEKILKFRAFILITLFTLIMTVVYSTSYNALNTIIMYLLMILMNKYIFDISIKKALIVVSFAILIYFIADAITATILLNFTSTEIIRGESSIVLLTALMVGIIAYQISNIKYFRKRYDLFIAKLKDNQNYDRVVFLVLLIFAFIAIFNNLNKFSNLNTEVLINILIFVILTVLAIIYIYEKTNNQKITNQYDALLEYVQNFEEIVEVVQLNSHEHKNNLATLRFLVENNKKAQKYIDEIIEGYDNVTVRHISALKHVPKGGVKGLLYYKYVIANKNNIEVKFEISNKVTEVIKEIQDQKLKIFCHLLGIYIDNAIEGASKSKGKIIEIEIYMLNDNLNIIISNTYDSINVNFDKIGQRGFSTKGKGRGNGLYFANKYLSQNPEFRSERIITDKYYTQKLIIEIPKEKR